jgi:hypothetical protein
MSFRSLNLTDTAPSIPLPAAVPLQATSPDVPHDVLRGLDTLHGASSRVLLELGLRGGDRFLVRTGVDPTDTVRTYPDKTTPRVVARASAIPLTPGHFVGVDVAALPSGPTQYTPGPSSFLPDGAGGRVEVEVTYTNGDAQTVTTTVTISLEPSVELYAAEPPNPWASMLYRSATAIPDGPLEPTASWWERWTRGGDVTVSFVVSYIGSPRVVDLVVVERPSVIFVESTSDRWPTAVYAQGGQPLATPPSDYPIEQVTGTDPAGGTASIRRALYAHGRELGPVLVGYSCATEHVGDLDDWVSYDTGTGDDEAPPATATGTTETLVGFELLSGTGVEMPAWIVGHYARQVDHGDDFLDGRTGVLPVWVAAYCRVSGDTGTFRAVTGEGWSEIAFLVTSTTWGWTYTPGWLEVGTGPEDAPALRLWRVNGDAAEDTEIRYWGIFARVRG